MLDKVELSDPSQLEVAAVVSGKMAMKKEEPTDDDKANLEVNNNSTNEGNDTASNDQKFPRSVEEQKVYDETITTTATSFKLLAFAGMKYLERIKSLSKRYVRKFGVI